MNADWTQRTGASTDTWDCTLDGGRGYVTQYETSSSYNWQFWRGKHGLSGISYDRDAAMAQAEAMAELPIEEFNERIVADLVDDLRRIEREIASISPTTDILPGYHAGYEAGVADIKRRIEAVIYIDGGQNA